MNLLPEAEERLNLVPIYATDGMKYREVQVVFYHMYTRWTWYVVESEPQPDGDYLMFCYCRSGLGPDCDEWGYTLLSQLQLPDITYYVPDAMQITQEGIILQ